MKKKRKKGLKVADSDLNGGGAGFLPYTLCTNPVLSLTHCYQKENVPSQKRN